MCLPPIFTYSFSPLAIIDYWLFPVFQACWVFHSRHVYVSQGMGPPLVGVSKMESQRVLVLDLLGNLAILFLMGKCEELIFTTMAHSDLDSNEGLNQLQAQCFYHWAILLSLFKLVIGPNDPPSHHWYSSIVLFTLQIFCSDLDTVTSSDIEIISMASTYGDGTNGSDGRMMDFVPLSRSVFKTKMREVCLYYYFDILLLFWYFIRYCCKIALQVQLINFTFIPNSAQISKCFSRQSFGIKIEFTWSCDILLCWGSVTTPDYWEIITR